jgi:MFS family permease
MSEHISGAGQVGGQTPGTPAGKLGSEALAPNAFWLLWAGFMAILAAGVGFAIRAGILYHWGSDYGFTGEELGRITGGGFTGFCFGIIIGGVIADKVGYGKLVISAFLLHILSAVVTFAPTPNMPKETVYELLFWGSFLFAVANGNLEAVANPLVATLFPHNRTHYLNILHASWPAGLVLGGAMVWLLDAQFELFWKYQLALYLLPVTIYGVMFLGQAMPRSEASKRGLSLGEMFKDVGLLGGLVVCFLLALFFSSVVTPLFTPKDATPEQADTIARTVSYVGYGFGGVLLIVVGLITRFSLGSFLLFVLFIAHALVGAVELGTDNWMQNITGNILTTAQGNILFVFTSAVMFSLRFCADFIEKKLRFSPVGILFTCACLACAGLLLTSQVNTFAFALLALGVYAVGKTFFWPTMLAVASDRFPRTGAVAISIMGGIGMMSAGLIGAPGLGYAKDRFAGEALREDKTALASQYQADKPSSFLFFRQSTGLDPKKLGDIQKKLKNARTILEQGKVKDLDQDQLAKLTKEAREEAEKEHAELLALMAKLKEAGVFKEGGGGDPKAAVAVLTPEEKAVYEASIEGDRRTLVADAAIPAAMACIYLGLLIYFRLIGGYKPLHIQDEDPASVEAAKHAGEA